MSSFADGFLVVELFRPLLSMYEYISLAHIHTSTINNMFFRVRVHILFSSFYVELRSVCTIWPSLFFFCYFYLRISVSLSLCLLPSLSKCLMEEVWLVQVFYIYICMLFTLVFCLFVIIFFLFIVYLCIFSFQCLTYW